METMIPDAVPAQPALQGAVIRLRTLTQDGAEAVVAAARDAAATLESAMFAPARMKVHIHVLARNGTLMAATQALGAFPGSDDLATRKARTALLFRMSTRSLGELSRPEVTALAPLYGIERSNGGLILFPGGLPLVDASGEVAGAIGVSGDAAERDEEVARAGADALKEMANAVAELPSLSRLGAEAVLAAARKRAATLDSAVFPGAKVRLHIHVVGADGTLLAAIQEDGAWPGSADIALRKALTALYFKVPTGLIGELSRPDNKGPLYGIEGSNGGLITFPGGLPLTDGAGNVLGAIGVSGDAVDRDEEVARAGADALGALLQPG